MILKVYRYHESINCQHRQLQLQRKKLINSRNDSETQNTMPPKRECTLNKQTGYKQNALNTTSKRAKTKKPEDHSHTHNMHPRQKVFAISVNINFLARLPLR